MTLPNNEPIPPAGFDLSPARRRRDRRQLIPEDENDRAVYLSELAKKVIPTGDYFIFSILSGMALCFAIFFDAPALYVLAALLAPFMSPAVGLGLATIVGSARFFLQCLGGILLGSIIVFIFSLGSGLFARFFNNLLYLNATYHTVFSWPDMLLLTVGAGLTTYFLLRSPNQRPLVASVAIAYELYVPIGVAGFGLTSGVPGLWPDGLIVFLVHIAWTALVVTITLALMRLRPRNFFGYGLATSIVLLSAAILVALLGFGTAVTAQVALPTAVPTPTSLPTITETPTITPTETVTPTNTLIPTKTTTPTLTPEPTLAQAYIMAQNANGAIIREAPNYGSKIIASLLNGYLVYILPDTIEDGATIWIHVRLNDNREGWIVRDLLTTATPAPSW